MKSIKVVAIILHDNKIFATERGYDDFKGGWEFPGGKVELGESLEVALVREIREELDSVAWLPADLGLIERLKGAGI